MSNTSKKMSYLLRHSPEDLAMDTEGFVEVSELLVKLDINMSKLEKIVNENDKQRFSFNSDKTKIRASQGHSVDIDLKLKSKKPPMYLYHGTSRNFLTSILKEGIKKKTRNHVHLSADIETAYAVGKRHSKGDEPVILQINCNLMEFSGFKFYLSDNKVWLCEIIPPEFIEEVVHIKPLK